MQSLSGWINVVSWPQANEMHLNVDVVIEHLENWWYAFAGGAVRRRLRQTGQCGSGLADSGALPLTHPNKLHRHGNFSHIQLLTKSVCVIIYVSSAFKCGNLPPIALYRLKNYLTCYRAAQNHFHLFKLFYEGYLVKCWLWSKLVKPNELI